MKKFSVNFMFKSDGLWENLSKIYQARNDSSAIKKFEKEYKKYNIVYLSTRLVK